MDLGYHNGPLANLRQILELKRLQADMSTSYDGNSGAEQRTFIRDAKLATKILRGAHNNT